MSKDRIHNEVVSMARMQVKTCCLTNSEPLQELLDTTMWKIHIFIRDELNEKS